MSTLLESFAAMLQGSSASTEAEPNLNSAILFTKLLNTKEVDLSTSVPCRDGKNITYGEILNSRQIVAERRGDSGPGPDYVAVWRLGQKTLSERITALKAMPNKAKSFSKKSTSAPADQTANGGLTEELLLNMFSKFLESQQPATPVAAEGHTISSTDSSVEEELAIDVAVGDVLRIRRADGTVGLVQLVERSNGAFGCNKTIV